MEMKALNDAEIITKGLEAIICQHELMAGGGLNSRFIASAKEISIKVK